MWAADINSEAFGTIFTDDNTDYSFLSGRNVLRDIRVNSQRLDPMFKHSLALSSTPPTTCFGFGYDRACRLSLRLLARLEVAKALDQVLDSDV